MDLKKASVLDTRLDLVNREETLRLVKSWLGKNVGKSGMKHVVTAYSEFYVRAMSDVDFRKALEGSDLVVPDGIGPLAAIRFQRSVASKDNLLLSLAKGMKIGFDILRGSVGETVPGVWLFEELVRLARKNGWSIFLLGGYGDVAKRLTVKLQTEQPGLVVGYDPGAQTPAELSGEFNEGVIEKINKFKPDLLFVAYGPGKQEKWIATNKESLKAGIAIGVGGTFDELTGKVKPMPLWMSRAGLKWLGRLIREPKRIKRIWNAVVVFPWLVFREK